MGVGLGEAGDVVGLEGGSLMVMTSPGEMLSGGEKLGRRQVIDGSMGYHSEASERVWGTAVTSRGLDCRYRWVSLPDG